MTDDDTEDRVSLVRRVPWRRLANVVGLLVVLAVVVPFVVYAVPQVVGAEHSYVVLSGSMEPTMSPGDVVIVNDVPASEVEKGDVITFAEGGSERPTTHRVIEVVEQNGEPAFRTKGDANENADRSLVTPADLEGKVMSVGGYLFVIPLIGYVIQFAGTTQGLVALLIVPLSLLVISEIWGVVTAATSGGSESAAAGEDDDGDDGDDEATVTEDTTNGDGDRIEDHETVLEPDTDSEAATIEELARRVEERPDAADASATDDVDTAAAAIGGKEPETPETADGEDGSEADEDAASEKEGSGEAASEEPEGLVFSAAELQLGLVVLFAFFAYSAWVAYATFFQVWAFAVAASTGAALLLLVGLYAVGGEAEPADQETEDRQETEGEQETEDEQQQTVDDDGSVPEADEESLFAASEDPVAETESEATTTTAEPDTDTVHGSPEVDIDELLSLGEASEVDLRHSALDLNGAEGASNADEEGNAPETSEVGDDD